MLSINAPGQGSQKPGMLSAWLELPGAVNRLERWSAASGLDLISLGTMASQDEIRDTAVTQPLVVAAALLAAGEMRRRNMLDEHSADSAHYRDDVVVAGHSIGELAALAIAGVIDDDDAVRLAAVRGAAMARACAEEATAMVAVLGGKEADVRQAFENAGLYPSNINGTGQIVGAGTIEACHELVANPPARAKVRVLEVAGAFHTPYMASAVDEFSESAAVTAVNDPHCLLLSNADGSVITDGREALDRIASQITSPVRWDLCMQKQLALGVTTFVELPPSGALTGIAKRDMRGVDRVAVSSPDELDSIVEFAPSAASARSYQRV